MVEQKLSKGSNDNDRTTNYSDNRRTVPGKDSTEITSLKQLLSIFKVADSSVRSSHSFLIFSLKALKDRASDDVEEEISFQFENRTYRLSLDQIAQ